jgi:hypothetical protein
LPQWRVYDRKLFNGVLRYLWLYSASRMGYLLPWSMKR